jgi:hypothetical protein
VDEVDDYVTTPNDEATRHDDRQRLYNLRPNPKRAAKLDMRLSEPAFCNDIFALIPSLL